MSDNPVKYFLNIQASIDPVWWLCRWSDMCGYVRKTKPGRKATGCLSRNYPFDVHTFIAQHSKESFMQIVASELVEHWRNKKADEAFIRHICTSFNYECFNSQI